MSIENQTVQKNEQLLDEKWFSRYKELAISAFELLDGDSSERTKQKKLFLSGVITHPKLDYPKLNEGELISREQQLLDLKRDILDPEQEQNDTVRKIYSTKINETIAELRMLRMTILGEDDKFSTYSKFIYGKPESENVATMAECLLDTIEEKKSAERIDVSSNVSSILAPVTSIDTIPDSLHPGISMKGRVSSVEEVASMFTQALEEIGADKDGWKVVTVSDESITNFRVSQARKEVSIPESKAGTMFKKTVTAFIAHEVHGHVKRGVEGTRTTLQLLSLGLDRVEKGEEGVATYNEQQIKGADTYSHPERYFAIALAMGEVDGIKRDFSQTFEVLKNYYLSTLKIGEDLEERANNAAWTLTVRVFRGTTGSTPGAVFTKDLAYFAGNKETWALVSTDSDVVNYFSVGKFDAYNARHVGWMTELGMVDGQLKEILEKTKLR